MFVYCHLNKAGSAAFRRLLRFLTVRCGSSRTCLASKTYGSVGEDDLVGCRGCLRTGSRKGIPVCSDHFRQKPISFLAGNGMREKAAIRAAGMEYEKHGTWLWNTKSSNYCFIRFGLFFFLILYFV